MIGKSDLLFHRDTMCRFKCKNHRTCKRYTAPKWYETRWFFTSSPVEENGNCYFHSLLGSYES